MTIYSYKERPIFVDYPIDLLLNMVIHRTFFPNVDIHMKIKAYETSREHQQANKKYMLTEYQRFKVKVFVVMHASDKSNSYRVLE